MSKDPPFVVFNRSHSAIVTDLKNNRISYIPMASDGLCVRRAGADAFFAPSGQWSRSEYDVSRAATKYLEHSKLLTSNDDVAIQVLNSIAQSQPPQSHEESMATKKTVAKEVTGNTDSTAAPVAAATEKAEKPAKAAKAEKPAKPAKATKPVAKPDTKYKGAIDTMEKHKAKVTKPAKAEVEKPAKAGKVEKAAKVAKGANGNGKWPAGDKAAKPRKTAETGAGRAPKYADTMKIVVKAKDNPKKATAAARFGKYKSGMTVADYKKAIGNDRLAMADINWDAKQEWITVS